MSPTTLRRRLAEFRWQLDRLGGYGKKFVVETDLSRLAELDPPSEVDIRPFKEADWSLLGDIMPKSLTVELDDPGAEGRTCLVAWKRRHAVGYAWFYPEVDCRHERCALPLPPDAVYIRQLEVDRSERRQGLAAALLSAGLKLRRDQGYQRSWVVLDPKNTASVRTIASVAPCQVLGTVAWLRIFGWIRCRYRELHAPFPIDTRLS
jgi:GNAT superfamily N-acetyltransferase